MTGLKQQGFCHVPFHVLHPRVLVLWMTPILLPQRNILVMVESQRTFRPERKRLLYGTLSRSTPPIRFLRIFEGFSPAVEMIIGELDDGKALAHSCLAGNHSTEGAPFQIPDALAVPPIGIILGRSAGIILYRSTPSCMVWGSSTHLEAEFSSPFAGTPCAIFKS